MIVVASENGRVGIGAAMDALRRGGSALDAVEAGCRLVEANRDDHSVGIGGYPNIDGVVELDASIMEGGTRRSGAVAALQGYVHAISVVRAVMERLPEHVLLVGEGAARFAREQGFGREEPLTDEARGAWIRHKAALAGGGDPRGLPSHEEVTRLAEQVRQGALREPDKISGTVNFIAQDGQGRIASAVTTSGWAFKYPGRVGDSPLIGAGNYCDDRFGACACTGVGEWSIRTGLARQVVLRMELGLELDHACSVSMADLESAPLPQGLRRHMSLVALDARGNRWSASTIPDRRYVWQRDDMAEHENSPCDFYLDASRWWP
ncbi:MAG TPA: N(4)-(beta-N-acetylglucosaminyl)-L-asparaginase [Chthonomonadaceae bacterium]|nr:N(4)-(beta-N-acetylglucosaminyl)-L-asparaginase [Chthonomonadaceae bacterium]